MNFDQESFEKFLTAELAELNPDGIVLSDIKSWLKKGASRMATNEGDRTVSDQDIRKHVAIIFEEPLNEIREALEDLLVNDRRKTAEINLLTHENRVQRAALVAIAKRLSIEPYDALDKHIRSIAEKALDWKASDPE